LATATTLQLVAMLRQLAIARHLRHREPAPAASLSIESHRCGQKYSFKNSISEGDYGISGMIMNKKYLIPKY